jgi:uncharacterized protein
MIDSNIRKKILDILTGIEERDEVCIFYACESGSRAWGFPSVDSDYDVRFLYLHKRDWYLSVDEGRDVIERPISDEIDLKGWDMKKALKLFRKSNVHLLEWLDSPIVYCDNYSIVQKMRVLLPEFYSPVSCNYHYLHMAESNYRDFLKGEAVWAKKYFYVLRPILACNWIRAGYGPVPIEFEKLVDMMIDSPGLKSVIGELLEHKKSGKELDKMPRIPEISDFVETELMRLMSERIDNEKPRPDSEKLNNLFRASLSEVWSGKQL